MLVGTTKHLEQYPGFAMAAAAASMHAYTALEATQGQMDSFLFSQLSYIYYLDYVASVGDLS